MTSNFEIGCSECIMVDGPGGRLAVGVGIPQVFDKGDVDCQTVCGFLAEVETFGFSSLWVQEAYLTPGSVLDPLELLTYAAALTEQVSLGVAVLVLPRHDPLVLAKRLATLDQLSGGRLIAGVGVGPSHDHAERPDVPLRPSRERFLEVLELLQELWHEPTVRHTGPTWRVEGESMEPKPRQRPRPPIWFGGSHPQALARAARLGDGWIGAGSSTLAGFVEHSRLLREQLEACGRDPSSFTIAKRVYLGVDDRGDRAQEGLARYLWNLYGTKAPPAEVAVVGPEDACLAELRTIIEAGATQLVFTPVFDDLAHLDVCARFADELFA